MANKRLQAERTPLLKGGSKIETITADAADVVRPVVYVEVMIDGFPVKAVVDSGAQSTILSRHLLHQVARHMQSQGRSVPKLVQPSVRLYGRSGNDRSELMISAQASLELTLDGRSIHALVFIQPGSEIQCLLGMNVLPFLGVQFVKENGVLLQIHPPPGDNHQPREVQPLDPDVTIPILVPDKPSSLPSAGSFPSKPRTGMRGGNPKLYHPIDLPTQPMYHSAGGGANGTVWR